MLRDAILNFPLQFSWEPKIENVENLVKYRRFIFAGMGGSGLAGRTLQMIRPEIDLVVHSNYGLPQMAPTLLKRRLFIASSYSGNTEEIVDGLNQAIAGRLPTAVITTGGKLLDIAQGQKLPYVVMPKTEIEPRLALGFSLRALLAIMGDRRLLKATAKLAKDLRPDKNEEIGKALAERIRGKFPIIYTSERNSALGYNWKIRFNETGKIPAFSNMLPELNHNEMTGFDVVETTRPLSERAYFIFLKDEEDHPKIIRRMGILEKLYKDRGLPVEVTALQGKNRLHKIFTSLNIADWASLVTGEAYGVPTEEIPMVEEFKRLIE